MSCKLANGYQFDRVIECVRNVACGYFYGFKTHKVFSPVFTRKDLGILKALGQKKELVVCKPDKGKGVVLLNKTDYVSKMEEIISDFTKFTRLRYDDLFSLTLKLEDKVVRFINKLHSLNVISDSEAKSLKPSGSSPATLYGLPKVHKRSVPLRPIMAAYNTATYKLAKFLVPILSPLTTNDYTVKNSYDLTDSLSNCRLPASYYMCSYDVQSLFTNIPINETIDICSKLMFQGVDLFRGMTKSVFKNLLYLCVRDGLFIFNNSLYKQVDGVAMGSPLGPTFANIFLCYHEKKWLDECPTNFKPILYRRYVDDTLVIFSEKDHATQFFNYINKQHDNIAFTMDTEQNDKISFLDILIEKANNKLNFSIYRKPTFSGLGTSFFSYCHFNFKINAIKTLLHRAFLISSTYSSFHNEITFLKKYFNDNGFTINLFEKLVNKYLNARYQPKIRVPTVNKEVIYVKLPYLGQVSTKITDMLTDNMSKFYPQIDFRFIPVNSFKISSFFNFKDRLPSALRSSVVYKYTCPSCQAGYVGSSIRAFKVRSDEHLGQSSRTGRRMHSPPHSSVRDHAEQCNVIPSRQHFEILDSSSNKDLRLLESLYIKALKPRLNNTQSAVPLYVA